MPSISAASAIDHVLLGCSDLEHGVAFVEQHTGVRPSLGGVHPGRGTRNALAALGERVYLEVIAPDPAQAHVAPWLTSTLPRIGAMTEPKVVGWAARPADIDALVDSLRAAGIAVNGPHAASRMRADGRVLRWKMATLADDLGGLLPFLMQWMRTHRIRRSTLPRDAGSNASQSDRLLQMNWRGFSRWPVCA